jgi:hypothetical protein
MAVPWPQKHDIWAKISLKRPSAEIPTGSPRKVYGKSDYANENRKQHSVTSAAAGVPFFPLVVSGWDPRPWREHRASFAFPTDAEWESELRMVQAQLAPRGTPNLGWPLQGGGIQPVFNIYAWNEFGEEGMMAPTQG